jgi:hypothetical protein
MIYPLDYCKWFAIALSVKRVAKVSTVHHGVGGKLSGLSIQAMRDAKGVLAA